MRSIKYLVARNIELFWNNKLNILLSAASIPIVISMYVFFLRNFLIGMAEQTILHPDYVKEFTDRMMFAGLLVVINTTTCFGIIQICVNDAATGIRRDFLVAPVNPFTMLLGYWIAAMIISCLFSYITILGGEVFFKRVYGHVLSMDSLFSILKTVLFSSCINAGILLCFAKNLKNTTTFSTFANLYGTVIGFLSGAYLPYYFYPQWLKPVLLWFPPTQVTSILRQEYIKGLRPWLADSKHVYLLANALQNFGIELKRKNSILMLRQQWAILILGLAVILLYLRISMKKE